MKSARKATRNQAAGLACCVLTVLLGLPAAAMFWIDAQPAAMAQSAAKVVQGRVFTTSEQPLSGCIVYLQDQSTNVVKTFITTKNGSYRFGQLPPETDYKIWARYKDEKSKPRLISSFDTNLNVTMDFHIGKK